MDTKRVGMPQSIAQKSEGKNGANKRRFYHCSILRKLHFVRYGNVSEAANVVVRAVY